LVKQQQESAEVRTGGSPSLRSPTLQSMIGEQFLIGA